MHSDTSSNPCTSLEQNVDGGTASTYSLIIEATANDSYTTTSFDYFVVVVVAEFWSVVLLFLSSVENVFVGVQFKSFLNVLVVSSSTTVTTLYVTDS